MLKNLFRCILMLCLMVAAVFSAVEAINFMNQKEESFSPVETAVQRKETEITAEVVSESKYILSTSNNKIAVYSGTKNSEPIISTNIDMNNLRNVDKELLRNGITVESMEEILLLLEDFNS